MKSTRAAAAALAVVGVSIVTGCGTATGDSAAPRSSTRAAWQFAPGEERHCSDTAIAERIKRAKAMQVQSNENSVLDTPPEVKAVGVPEGRYDEQLAEWKKLSPADRLFQLCFAVDQGFSRD